jgi:hypothetical protein
MHLTSNCTYFNKTPLSYTVTQVANCKGSEILTLISNVLANDSLMMQLQT